MPIRQVGQVDRAFNADLDLSSPRRQYRDLMKLHSRPGTPDAAVLPGLPRQRHVSAEADRHGTGLNITVMSLTGKLHVRS